MPSTENPVLQRGGDAKDAILETAEKQFLAAGVIFRPGRMAKLVNRALAREGIDAALVVVDEELSREEMKAARPVLRNWVGILDPTGQTAAANVDRERALNTKKTPALTGVHDQNTNR